MPFKSEKQRRWMHANKPKMAKKWEKKEKMKKETRVRQLIKKMVREIMSEMNEGFAGALKKEDRKEFDKGRRKQSEVLGYELTGKDDIKTEIDDATVTEAKKRDYKAEYKKFQSSTKAKKYRAELNKYNRQKGTYGNGDKKDASHKGGKIVGFEEQSKNRGRREKSRLKKEACQKGYKTHPTRKTKIMFGKRYRNCIKAEDIQKISEDKIYSKADGLKKVKSVSKKGKVYKVDKQKAKYSGKNITMYTLYTKYKNHTSGQNPFGLDMARNSKGEAMYLVPIQEGKLTEKVSDKQKRQTYKKAFGKEYDEKRQQAALPLDIAYQVALYRLKKLKEGKLNEAKPYETILQQLGGNRFVAMTGAKNLGTSGKDLSFSIGRNAKKVTHVHIKLTSMDLYDVEFINMRGAKRKVIKKVKGVYGDMLPKIFKKYTGMNTRL